jgi:hypothetical protein
MEFMCAGIKVANASGHEVMVDPVSSVPPHQTNKKITWESKDDNGGYDEDPTADLICQSDVCSTKKCGFQARCVAQGGFAGGQQHCLCKNNYVGDPFKRCLPRQPPSLSQDPNCQCQRLLLSSSLTLDLISHKFMPGAYFHSGFLNGKPVYQHEKGDWYIFYELTEPASWVVSENLGKNLGLNLINVNDHECPINLDTPWQYNENGEFKEDRTMVLACYQGKTSSSSSTLTSQPQTALTTATTGAPQSQMT